MPKLDAIAPILWAKWGGVSLEALRQAALDAGDGLAFEAMNTEAGIRTLLVVCTTDRALIQTLEETLELKGGRPPRRVGKLQRRGDDLPDGERQRPRPPGAA